jgi:tetratricopeptide (TPR) repeat protein
MKDTSMADKTSIMKEAHKYLAKGQIDKAIAEWEKLTKESPDGNTHNIIGDLYLKKGDKKNAVVSFHRAAKFFRFEGFSLKALALYKKALNINPADPDALYALGELSEEKGLTTDSIKYYLAAADSLSKEGKKDRILNVYEKILSLSPSNIPLRTKVAEIFLKEGLRSETAKEYVAVAKIYEEKGDIHKSREFYQKTLELQPSHKEALIGIVHLCEASGEVETAIEHMRKATEFFPDDTDVFLRYAELLAAGGHDETAKDVLSRLIGKEPSDTRIRRLLGDIKLKAGLHEEAWLEYIPVIDGMIQEEKYEAAIKFLEAFRRIDPLETGKRLVSLYRKIGQDAQAASELANLGDVLNERGLREDALSCYGDALEINPDDSHVKEMIDELVRSTEPQKEAVTIPASIEEKTAEEIFAEADIFSRYGLPAEAIRVLEGLKLKEPENLELHTRLKSLYAGASDKESAVTECLILSELYELLGNGEDAEKMLREASEISPEDPRLAQRGFPIPSEHAPSWPGSEELVEAAETAPTIEDYSEEIAEADFYVRQGLSQEALKILERLHGLFPENGDISERLNNLGQISEAQEIQEAAGMPEGMHEAVFAEEPSEESTKEVAGLPSGTEGYEDLMFTEQDLVDAQEMPEPTLDNEVLEIFQEFKKGLEKELVDEDSETHYNLGIAYKEMGLIDDAITEFQTSKADPKRFLQSATMLGVCYMEKGLYSLAIDTLNEVLRNVTDKDESYWALKYELAEAHEKNNNLREALELYTEVYGWNAKFRNVSEKLDLIATQTRLPKDSESEKPQDKKGGEPEKPKMKRDRRVSYL